jgi:hypothetical protein
MISLTDLAELIHRVAAKQGGCSVNLTTITVPEHGRGELYAIVHYGRTRNGHPRFSRVCHDTDELLAVLNGGTR